MIRKFFALAYSLFCFLLFNLVFLYFIAFVGNFGVPYPIDGNYSDLPFTSAVMVNILLIAVFGIQHSIMARLQFKQWWMTLVPKPLERSTYVLGSCLALGLLCGYWHPLPQVIWQVENEVGRMLLWGLFVGGWLLSFFASFLISHLDLLGVRQAYFYYVGKEYIPVPFEIVSVYKYIRHPIMLGTLIGLWATPQMSVGHVLLATGLSVYIFIGVYFEEKDLCRVHGKSYEEYKQKTWRIFPIFTRG